MKDPEVESRIELVLGAHFDPRWGSRFWLDRAKRLGFDPRRELRTQKDLFRLGPFPLEALARRKVEDFVPRRFHELLRTFTTSETGGTTGPAKRTVFSPPEFEAAFVIPFVRAAEAVGFPRGLHWLFVGPSGPHAIGKAARACAAALGSMDPFSVDFDPRWVRRLPADSMARTRYVEHVLGQAEAVLASQEVGVLFATPPVVTALGRRLASEKRDAIRGLHLGGMAADPGFWKALGEWFPRAVVLGGYGNSLAGVCPQLGSAHDGVPEYFPHGARLRLQLVDRDADGRGHVCFHRLDETTLLPAVVERDVAWAVVPPPEVAAEGFRSPGVRDPRPPEDAPAEQKGGLY